MKLTLTAPHASVEDRDKGLAAAFLFLKEAGISVDDAKQGLDARTLWNECGLSPALEPHPGLLAAADAWDSAMDAAFLACYGTRSTPWGACLRIVTDRPSPPSAL